MVLRDLDNAAHLRVNLATLCSFDGRGDEALRLLREARAHYRRCGLLRSDGFASINVAFAHLSRGRPTEAQRSLAEARETFRAAGFPLGEASALGFFARLEHHAGRPAEALARYEEVIGLLPSTSGLRGGIEVLTALAAADLGDFARAQALRERAARTLSLPRAADLLALVDAALSTDDADDVGARIREKLGSIEFDRILS